MRLADNASYRFVRRLDVNDLTDAVLTLSEQVWQGAFRRKTDMHPLNQDVDSIVIRHGVTAGSPIYRNTEAYAMIREPLEGVLKQLPGADRVRLARLHAGKHIPLHIDQAPYFEVQHRLHIPLTTNPAVYFVVQDEVKCLAVGEVWEINNIVPHEVRNYGNSDRIHMVVDYYDI